MNFAWGLQKCLFASANFSVAWNAIKNQMPISCGQKVHNKMAIFHKGVWCGGLPLQFSFAKKTSKDLVYMACVQGSIEICPAAVSENVLNVYLWMKTYKSDKLRCCWRSCRTAPNDLTFNFCLSVRHFSECWWSIRGMVCRGGDCRSSAVNKAPQTTTCMWETRASAFWSFSQPSHPARLLSPSS